MPKLPQRSKQQCKDLLSNSIEWQQSALSDTFNDCVEIGGSYMAWSAKSEKDIMDAENKHQKAYVGRGAPQRFVTHAIVRASGTPDRKRPPTGHDIPADELGWTMIELNLSALLCQRLRGQFNRQRHRAIEYLQNDAVQFINNSATSTTSTTEYFQLWMWHHLLLSICLVSNQQLAMMVMNATKKRTRRSTCTS